MMADFVMPRHSAVMERLRRRIELFRRHHTSCETRYDNTAMERLEMERQQTLTLHQRCLQTKAKRSSKHRQPQPTSDQTTPRGSGTGGGTVELTDSGTPAGEPSRNSTLIALQETVKRKLESAGSPLGRDQINGFGDGGYPPSKKACVESSLGGLNGAANGALPPLSPLDTKHGIGADALVHNGTHGGGAGAEQNGTGRGGDGRGSEQEMLLLKDLKQEPIDDILPTPGGAGGNNSLFHDLNLNEQEWSELMEEFNCTVDIQDINDIFNDTLENGKDPELPPAGSRQPPSQQPPQQPGLLPPDLANIKTEFGSAFEQEPRTSSPHMRPAPAGPGLHTSSPIASAGASAASSPALQQPQPQAQAQPARQLPQNHLMPGPPKDLSPAQQLQQMAAAREQQRTQMIQNQQQVQKQQQQHQQHQQHQQQHQQHHHQQQQQQQQRKQQQQQQQQQQAKFHAPPSHPSSWPQAAAPPQSQLFVREKPGSPSLYQQDFPAPKALLLPGQPPSKGSPKAAGAGAYLQPGGHPGMLGHPAPGPAMGHPQGPGGPPTAMPDYSNTKPLTHFEGVAQQGQAGAPNQKVLLSMMQQQQQQQQQQQAMKQKAGLPFRPTHLPHPQQDQGAYPSAPHVPGPGNGLANQQGGNPMAGNHGNAAYLSSQAQAQAQALKQQQQQQMHLMEQQHFLRAQQQRQQQQQLMAGEQEKQRQQQEQIQRHLTRPPPQYQDQQNQPANQNPFQQQTQVSQFPGSSQPMGNPLGAAAPAARRMFPQNPSMLGMGVGQGGGPAPGAPPTAGQADMSLSACGGGGLDVGQVLYSSMPMHPAQQRPAVGAMPGPFRQNVLAQQQQQLLKNQPGAALLKQQMARLPGSMPNPMASGMGGSGMSGSMPPGMPTQAPAWQQQQQQQQQAGMQQAMGAQPSPSNGGMPAGFGNQGFHMQPRMPKMPAGAAFGQTGMSGRPMGGMSAGQMMPGMPQQRTNNPSLGQPQGQQGAPQGPPPQAQLPDLSAFGQPPPAGVPSRAAGMPCGQGYAVSRTSGQQLAFGYSGQPNASLPSFPGESELVDSLLKGQATQEWMDDLDELLASHQ